MRRTRVGRRNRLIAMVMCTGVYVSIEPAPIDIGLIALGGLTLASRGRITVPRSTAIPFLCLCAFCLSIPISLVGMHDPSLGYRDVATKALLLATWGVLVLVQGRGGARSTHAILEGFAIGGVLAAAVGIAAYLGAPGLGSSMIEHRRLMGMFKDPNVFGAYLVPVTLIITSRLIQREGRRWIWCFALAVVIGGVFLSFSRGAWVNLAVALASFFALFTCADGLGRAWWRTFVFFPLGMVLLGAVVWKLVSVPEVAETFAWRFGMQGYDDERFAVQGQLLAQAIQHPIGFGPAGTQVISSRASHNLYIHVFVENGILGLTSLSAFLAASWVRSLWMAVSTLDFRDRLRFAVIGGALTGMLVESFVIGSLHWRHLWVFCALAWAWPSARGRARGR